ncbi:hypothetical protein Mp_2g25690 [Marchantia polymorpha subsp. ruderalis]|uniref:Uncharacterized protein n=1 Tax=Marchantia polymorpha TaxID=3197 RepID=A0A2R6XBH3_MARPO|nr:hypothetical protein MARPO_0025s0109 [Marchantia polymorpha]BBN03705.1 hypothetical protein Mp_2g25690 [Marchantia polymorpha subsp. ruderalis]|eukprot:PTQ43427.1 hypothetical protein MARPO_0025s0109 [Marchantia polymorpha]
MTGLDSACADCGKTGPWRDTCSGQLESEGDQYGGVGVTVGARERESGYEFFIPVDSFFSSPYGKGSNRIHTKGPNLLLEYSRKAKAPQHSPSSSRTHSQESAARVAFQLEVRARLRPIQKSQFGRRDCCCGPAPPPPPHPKSCEVWIII